MYQVTLALHLIFIVTWFAGLFYVVRLFVYFAEVKELPEIHRDIFKKQYQLMTKRLWYGITWPSFILSLIFGPALLIQNPSLLKAPFMHVKLTLVVGLIIYHFLCHFYFKRQQKDSDEKSSNFYRVWNEVATLFLVSIVFVIILKSAMNWIYATVGFILFGVILMLAIKIYKKVRHRSKSK
jgi:putative membrane protein